MSEIVFPGSYDKDFLPSTLLMFYCDISSLKICFHFSDTMPSPARILTMHFPSFTFSDQFSSFQPRRGARDTMMDITQTKEINIQIEVEFLE